MVFKAASFSFLLKMNCLTDCAFYYSLSITDYDKSSLEIRKKKEGIADDTGD